MRHLSTSPRQPVARPHRALTFTLTLAVMMLLAIVFVPGVAADEPITVTILHTNDTHANIQPCTATCNNGNLGGVARRSTVIQQVRAEGGNVLLVDAGDYFQGTLFFNYWQGQEASHFMTALGYQAAAIGNHEFDSGPEALARYIDAVDFPVLAANIDASAQVSLTGLIEPYSVIEVGGQSIGVFGLTTPDTTFISSPGPDVTFADATATAQATVAALQGMGVNKIVALTHLGYDPDLALAAAVDGIDVIVGGHSHTPLGPMPNPLGDYPTVVASPNGDPVLVVTAFEWGKWLGRLDVTFDANGVVDSYNGAPVLIDASIPEDPAIAADVAAYYAPVQQLANTVVAQTEVFLDGVRANVRTRETNMGNLICDAMLWKTANVGSQICITNGGGIRAPINPGDITIGSVLTVLPFGNTVATLGLTGTDVIAALENGVSRWENTDGRFAQVAGIRYSFDPERPAGHRILSAELKNPDGSFSPIDPDEIYIVTTNNFMRNGGDGYTVFRDNAIDPYDTWAVMADSVVEYIQQPLGGVVTEAAYPESGDGRITKVTANVNRSRRFNVSQDTFINGNQPNSVLGSAMTMWVGFNDTMRPVVEVPVPVCDNPATCVPADAFVDLAYLYVYVYEGRGFANWNQSAMLVSAHPVNTMWDQASATWVSPWTNPGGDVGPAISATPLGNGRIGTWLRLDVTDAVADIVSGAAPNYGFVLASDPNFPLEAPEATLNARFGFATTEFFDPSKAGYMRVFFRTYD